jgi:putative ABC transport system permease protein
MTRLVETVRMALDAVRSSPLRALLAILGIVIGIVAVVSTMTAANGIASSFQATASSLGADVLYVTRMPWIMNGGFFDFRNCPASPCATGRSSSRASRRAGLQPDDCARATSSTARRSPSRSTSSAPPTASCWSPAVPELAHHLLRRPASQPDLRDRSGSTSACSRVATRSTPR